VSLNARLARLERAGAMDAQQAHAWGSTWMLRVILAEAPGDARTERVRSILAELTGGDPDGWQCLERAEFFALGRRLGAELARRGMLAG